MKYVAIVLVGLSVGAVCYMYGRSIGRDETRRYYEPIIVADSMAINKLQWRVDRSPCPTRDYQIEIYDNTVWIFDCTRPVGRYYLGKALVDSFIMADNQ